MGDITDLILDGVLDYETGEYIGSACGYPRTIKKLKNGERKGIPKYLMNRYGYDYDDWSRMKPCTREIIKFLYSKGYTTVLQRQDIIDKFSIDNKFFKENSSKLPRNSRKYSLIYEKFNEFKLYVEQLTSR